MDSISEHMPDRPGWDCRKCLEPWPCAPAKVELSEEYQRFSSCLTVYLASCLADAIDDLAAGAGGIPRDLFGRFLGWAKRPEYLSVSRTERL